MERDTIKERLHLGSKSDTKDSNMAGGQGSALGSTSKKVNVEVGEITTEKVWEVLQQLVFMVNALKDDFTMAKGTVTNNSFGNRLNSVEENLVAVTTKLNLVGNIVIHQEEKTELSEEIRKIKR